MDSDTLEMRCQCCGAVGKLLSCGKCFSGYYCSADCQRKSWSVHKIACGRVADTTKCNPWYAPVSPSEPRFVHPKLINIDEVVDRGFDVFIKSDHNAPRNLNTLRGPRGETLLHMAVIMGDLGAVKSLIEHGAYVNCVDWWRNNPLYYACSHNGDKDSDDIYDSALKPCDHIESALSANRLEIVKYLVSVGADTMAQGGYSGLRSYEAARHYGYNEIVDFIENSEESKKLKTIRELVNKEVRNKETMKVVKHLTDVFWRADTCHWLIQPNRSMMALNLNPHPELIWVVREGTAVRPTIDDIERMFVDLAIRHHRYHGELMKK